MMFEPRRVSLDFSRAAGTYDAHASLQREVLAQAVAMLAPRLGAQARILDAGCGTGAILDTLLGTHLGYNLFGVDIAEAMCAKAAARGLPAVCAPIASLPFAAGAWDAAVCSLVMQWLEERTAAFSELNRVIPLGGYMIATIFGQRSLQELRAAFAAADASPRVSPFPSAAQFLHDAQAAGWACVRQETQVHMHYFPALAGLMHSIKSIGAGNKLAGRRRGLTAPSVLRAAERHYGAFATAKGLPATWEVHYLLLRKPGGGV